MFEGIENSSILTNSKWVDSFDALYIALALASVSLLISAIHIVRHLKNYTMPEIQVYVIRILLTCPMYAITSSLALLLGPYGIYAEVIRDVYEAFVIYSFLNLILEYAGGETDCVYLIENEPLLRFPFPLCMMKPRARDARLMRFCHRGVLQFIVTKPIVALADVVLLATGLYFHPVWQTIQIVVYNISYGWALYCLFVFYLATKPVIRTFRPIAKFSTVKAIIFATYYQSMILHLTLSTPEKAIRWNDFLLCGEMVLFSALLMVAFPVKEFIGGIPDRRVLQNVKEVFAVRELMQAVYHNFNPAYRDYALQRSQTETPVTVRLQTHFSNNMNPVAMEMTQRYRGRSKRFAFNSLLRGTRPVRARLRRQHLNYEDDIYHCSLADTASSNSSSSSSGGSPYVSSGTVSALHTSRSEEWSSSRSSRSNHSSPQSSISSSPVDPPSVTDSDYTQLEEGLYGNDNSDISESRQPQQHLGRLTISKAAPRSSPVLSEAVKANHLLYRIPADCMTPLTPKMVRPGTAGSGSKSTDEEIGELGGGGGDPDEDCHTPLKTAAAAAPSSALSTGVVNCRPSVVASAPVSADPVHSPSSISDCTVLLSEEENEEGDGEESSPQFATAGAAAVGRGSVSGCHRRQHNSTDKKDIVLHGGAVAVKAMPVITNGVTSPAKGRARSNTNTEFSSDEWCVSSVDNNNHNNGSCSAKSTTSSIDESRCLSTQPQQQQQQQEWSDFV